jgi:hypothetical protein
MKIFFAASLLIAFMTTVFGQDKTLVADGTLDPPVRAALQPTVEKLSAAEVAAVRKEALARRPEFDSDRKAVSSEESNFKKDFELLDVAEGFFIYREIRFRAYLYTAYSAQATRNYHGIIVMRPLANRTRFTVAAHYVYEYRGDRFLRALPDINGNLLGELAVYSVPPTKKDYRKEVRMLEFSPNGLEKIGLREIFSSVPQKQKMPYRPDKSKPAKMIYIPPKVDAIKLFAVKELNEPLEFYEERWRRNENFWGLLDKLQLRPAGLEEDKTDYVELFKPVFPKGPGEK